MFDLCVRLFQINKAICWYKSNISNDSITVIEDINIDDRLMKSIKQIVLNNSFLSNQSSAVILQMHSIFDILSVKAAPMIKLSNINNMLLNNFDISNHYTQLVDIANFDFTRWISTNLQMVVSRDNIYYKLHNEDDVILISNKSPTSNFVFNMFESYIRSVFNFDVKHEHIIRVITNILSSYCNTVAAAENDSTNIFFGSTYNVIVYKSFEFFKSIMNTLTDRHLIIKGLSNDVLETYTQYVSSMNGGFLNVKNLFIYLSKTPTYVFFNNFLPYTVLKLEDDNIEYKTLMSKDDYNNVLNMFNIILSSTDAYCKNDIDKILHSSVILLIITIIEYNIKKLLLQLTIELVLIYASLKTLSQAWDDMNSVEYKALKQIIENFNNRVNKLYTKMCDVIRDEVDSTLSLITYDISSNPVVKSFETISKDEIITTTYTCLCDIAENGNISINNNIFQTLFEIYSDAIFYN